MNLSFVNSRRIARGPNVVRPPHMASPEPPAARPFAGAPVPTPPPTPRPIAIDEIVVHVAELLEVRPTDTLLVPMPETWTSSHIENFVRLFGAALRRRNIHVAEVLAVPGGREGAFRVQVLRQKEIT